MKLLQTLAILLFALTLNAQKSRSIDLAVSPSFSIYTGRTFEAEYIPKFSYDTEASLNVFFTKRIGISTGLVYTRQTIRERYYYNLTGIMECDHGNGVVIHEDAYVDYFHNIDYFAPMFGINFKALTGKHALIFSTGFESLFLFHRNERRKIHYCGIKEKPEQSHLATEPVPLLFRLKFQMEYALQLGGNNAIFLKPYSKFGLNPLFFHPDNNGKLVSYGVFLGYRKNLDWVSDVSDN